MARAHQSSEDTKLIVTVLVLLLAYPIGLILMWIWTRWPIWLKVLITSPILLALLAVLALMSINPQAQIDKAKNAHCAQQCQDATSSACFSQCLRGVESPRD